jgi:hypothetical protein
MRRRYGAPNALTHTKRPAEAAAHGWAAAGTWIRATVDGPPAAEAAEAVASAIAARTRIRRILGYYYDIGANATTS